MNAFLMFFVLLGKTAVKIVWGLIKIVVKLIFKLLSGIFKLLGKIFDRH